MQAASFDMYEYLKEHPLILAPMAGVSDVVYRQLCLEQGASLTFMEMVSAKGLSYDSRKSKELLDIAQAETEVGVQLFGHEPDIMASQAANVEEMLGDNLAYIDINMGCPARKIITKGDGASLMTVPELAASIVRAVRGAVAHPVTVKFRRGFEEGDETAVEFAKRMEDAGACAMTVHGRYAKQMYRGKSDRAVIAKVKQAVPVPVIGNGDVMDVPSYLNLLDVTGCDAVMIARGSQGNPWIFRDCLAAHRGLPIPDQPTFEDRLNMAKRHAFMLSQIHGDRIVMMRAHSMHYLHGMPGAATCRNRLSACTSYVDFATVFDDMLARLEGEER